MARSVLGQYSSSSRRREGLPWSSVVGLLFAALLVNYVGLYGTGRALSEALEPTPPRAREELVNFDLVEPDGEQLVQQHRADDRTPEHSERRSDVDSDPEHETQAPLVPDGKTSTANKPGPQRDPSESAKGKARGELGDAQGEAEGSGEGQQPGPGDDSLVDAADGQVGSQGADSGATKGTPDPLAKLGGSPSVLDQTFGRPGSDDRLVDVDEGVENILQSKRHLFASFFNRIRDQVSDQWRPERAHRAADPNGTRYGDKQRTTVLMVRLDAGGEVLKIVVERSSGAPHLDEEAIRAMRAAAPFPNPPTGLADSNGHIDFRFGFILDFTGGSRIFRYQH